MRITSNKVEKVWARHVNVSEVPRLADIGEPSETNRAYWQATQASHMQRLLYRDPWLGGVSYEEMQEMLVHGWPEGAQRALALAESFRDALPEPTQIKRRKVWSDQGDDLDRDRLMLGHVDQAWRRTTRTEQVATKVVRVAMPWAHGSKKKAHELFWSGAAAMALTDLLETAGYSVELLAVNAVTDRANVWMQSVVVTVKEAGDPLRPDAVAALFCHAAPYRYYGITAIGGAPTRVGNRWGHIYAASVACAKLDEAGALDKADIILPHVYREYEAIAAISSAVATLDKAAAATF
jgi:hypothetical protein